MNLMSIATQKWDDNLLRACGGPELREKLAGEPVAGGSVLGTVAQWWIKRYGFSTGKPRPTLSRVSIYTYAFAT